MNDYITPESGYPIGHGDHYDLLAALSRELLAGETLRYGSVTATATSCVDRTYGPELTDCDAFGAARVFLHLVGPRKAREALEGARIGREK